MKLIELNKSYYNFPESWDELTGKQLLQVMEVLYLKNYKAEQMLLQLVRVLAGLSLPQFFRCKPEELEEYFYKLVFLLEGNISFTKNHLPLYHSYYNGFRKINYHGPEDGLENLTMKEFVFSEQYFLQWVDSEKKDQEALAELVAILYRPRRKKYNVAQNKDGDPREPYNQNICSWHAKEHITHWPPSVKLAIATWYTGCRLSLVQNNPDVFASTGGAPAKYGLVSVMMDVAKDGTLGSFEAVEGQYVHLVMMLLNEMVAKAREIKRQLK